METREGREGQGKMTVAIGTLLTTSCVAGLTTCDHKARSLSGGGEGIQVLSRLSAARQDSQRGVTGAGDEFLGLVL